MKYDLIKDGKILQTRELNVATVLSANKGVWLERVQMPESVYDPLTQKLEYKHTVTSTQSQHGDKIIDMTKFEIDIILANMLQAKIAQAEKLVESHIQEQIDSYNLANGVHFDNVHNCANYINSTTYSHYQFCVDIWAFNVACWEEARIIQIGIATGNITEPADEAAFLALLPVFA